MNKSCLNCNFEPLYTQPTVHQIFRILPALFKGLIQLMGEGLSFKEGREDFILQRSHVYEHEKENYGLSNVVFL